MTVLIRKTFTRRRALRAALGGGIGTMALPFLDCFLNENGTALAATGAPLPVRFGTWYWGMGHTPGRAIVDKAQTAPGIEFLEETKALKPHRDKITYLGNFNVPLDGNSNYTHFTGWVTNRTGSAPTRGGEIPGTTLDLLIADVIGTRTRFKTLDVTSVGIARENYSARGTNSRGAAEGSPVALYARLFGPEFVDPNQAQFKPDPAIVLQKSVLSSYLDESKEFIKGVGAADKARLDEYFTSVRQVENQLALQLEKPPKNDACAVPQRPGDPAADRLASVREMGNVIESHKLMTKLLTMAVACDQTRVFNMVFTDNFGNVRRNGETYTHHLLTHEEAIDPRLGYQPLTFWFNQECMNGFATYLDALSGIKEGAGTLLDNCAVFATSETNYARVHTIDGIPTYLAGSAGGRLKTGLHVVGNGDPITRIGFTLMRAMGVPIERWGTKSLQTSKPITEILA